MLSTSLIWKHSRTAYRQLALEMPEIASARIEEVQDNIQVCLCSSVLREQYRKFAVDALRFTRNACSAFTVFQYHATIPESNRGTTSTVRQSFRAITRVLLWHRGSTGRPIATSPKPSVAPIFTIWSVLSNKCQ